MDYKKLENIISPFIKIGIIDEDKTVFISSHIISDLEKIADYLVYIRDGEIILNDSIESLMSKFQIIKGNHNDLDEELEELLIYRETRKTGYTALTQHAQTFKEIFGNEIEVQNLVSKN